MNYNFSNHNFQITKGARLNCKSTPQITNLTVIAIMLKFGAKRMTHHPHIHRRRSTRLRHYDYSQAGLYFITICCRDKIHFLGEIVDGKMVLNAVGRAAYDCWLDIPNHFHHAVLHDFVIMPNHIHGIIEIAHAPCGTVGAKNLSPLHDTTDKSAKLNGTSKTIGSIVRGFKIGVTKWVRTNTDIHTIWQRNYHDHIIRNETAYWQIVQYIRDNPLAWEYDELNK